MAAVEETASDEASHLKGEDWVVCNTVQVGVEWGRKPKVSLLAQVHSSLCWKCTRR
jgi:hypothetical protein